MPKIFQNFKKINSILNRKDRIRFVLLAVLMFAGSILEAIGVGLIPVFMAFILNPASFMEHEWVSRISLDVTLPETVNATLLFMASTILVTFTLLKNGFLAFVFYWQARLVNNLRVILSDRMFRVYQEAPYEWHLKRSSAEILRNIRDDVNQVLNNAVMALLDMLMAVLMSVAVTVVLLVNTSVTAFAGMGLMGAGLIAVITLSKRVVRESGEVQRQEAEKSVKAIQQGFSALVDARINERESFLARRFRESMSRLGIAIRRQTTVQKITPYAIETCAIIGLLLVVYSLLLMSNSAQSIVPVLSLFGVAAVRLKQTASQIASSYHRINASRSYIDGIVTDLEELDLLEVVKSHDNKEEPYIGGFESLKLEGVSYTYPGASAPAVEDISLQISKGESVSFVGTTGGGKSTLMKLILGLIDPSLGTVKINGHELRSVHRQWWRMIGYVPQYIFILDETIRENVAFGCPVDQIDDEKVWHALSQARLDDYVRSQPQELDTRVGERGAKMSGGQIQRLGIARALYKKPEVLLMDEATSALDTQTETDILMAFDRLKVNGITKIIIAHRDTAIEKCDTVYDVEQKSLRTPGY